MLIQRMWSLETFDEKTKADTKLTAEHETLVQAARTALERYLAKPSQNRLLALAGAYEELPAGTLRDGIEAESLVELQKYIKEPPKDPSGEEVIASRLQQNAFRVDSSLGLYKSNLPHGFADALAKLGPGDRWLEGGAGEARAMREYLGGGGPATGVAFSFKRPETGGLPEFAKENTGRFTYHEGDFAKLQTTLDPDTRGFKLITDHNGVLMYTKELSQDLERYLSFLVPGGRMFFVLIPTDTVIDDKVSPEKIAEWLGKIAGVRLASRKGGDGWELERTTGEVKVPQLTLESYETIKESNAPHRRFRSS
jgi:hypothetical protein